MLQEGVSEADNVFQELLRVFGWLVHLECKETNSHYVVSEDERAENVGVFAILLRDLVRLRTTGHKLDYVQNLVKQLDSRIEFFVGHFFVLALDIRLLDTSSVQCAV